MKDATELLVAAGSGDDEALSALFALLYAELRRLARAKLRAHRTLMLLDTTSLVHECYLRLVDSARTRIADRAHFFAYASRVMRSVIVDFVRERKAQRRGGGQEPLTLDTLIQDPVAEGGDDDILRLNDAIDELARVNPRLASIVEMRYFAGYTERQIAEALAVSERTVKRDWAKARVLLRAALS